MLLRMRVFVLYQVPGSLQYIQLSDSSGKKDATRLGHLRTVRSDRVRDLCHKVTQYHMCYVFELLVTRSSGGGVTCAGCPRWRLWRQCSGSGGHHRIAESRQKGEKRKKEGRNTLHTGQLSANLKFETSQSTEISSTAPNFRYSSAIHIPLSTCPTSPLFLQTSLSVVIANMQLTPLLTPFANKLSTHSCSMKTSPLIHDYVQRAPTASCLRKYLSHPHHRRRKRNKQQTLEEYVHTALQYMYLHFPNKRYPHSILDLKTSVLIQLGYTYPQPS